MSDGKFPRWSEVEERERETNKQQATKNVLKAPVQSASFLDWSSTAESSRAHLPRGMGALERWAESNLAARTLLAGEENK